VGDVGPLAVGTRAVTSTIITVRNRQITFCYLTQLFCATIAPSSTGSGAGDRQKRVP
jgi:hypothetical protein